MTMNRREILKAAGLGVFGAGTSLVGAGGAFASAARAAEKAGRLDNRYRALLLDIP